MNEPTDWVSAIAILASGLILGLLFVTFFNRRKSAAGVTKSDLELLDLEAKRDALISQLRALGPDEVDERARLERETAAVLRQIEGRGPRRPSSSSAGSSATAPAAPAAPQMSPALQGVLWGAGTFLLLGGLAYFTMKQATPKDQQAGMAPAPMQSQQQQAPDPAVQALEAQVQANPDDMELRTNLAQAYLERDNLMGVYEQTNIVLAKQPNHSRAMAFNALVRLAMGEAAVAQQMLEKATKIDPKNMDGWVALAWVHAQTGKMDEAGKAIDAAKKNAPENAARLDDVLNQMKTAAAQQASGQPAAAAGGDLPAGHPPIDGAPVPAGPIASAPAPAQGGAPAAGGSVKVTLELDPAAKVKNGVVYVMARNAGGGPPVAVKRIMSSQLPLTFDFGAADSMMGQPLPASFRLEARLDSDGDAASKNPNDPIAAQDGVKPGSAVKLAMK